MLKFFQRELLQRKSFVNIDEAVSFFIDVLNKQVEGLEEIFKDIAENNYKEHLIIKKTSELMCDKLAIYGMKISYEDLRKQAKAAIDKDWPKIKKEVAETLEARDKAINDLLKDA